MHEMSLMASIMEIADNQLVGVDFQRVLKIRLQVGQLANALEDALRFAFEAFSKNTLYESAELEIVVVPATWQCPSCGHQFESDIGVLKCPKCAGQGLQLIKGRDLVLESLEVE